MLIAAILIILFILSIHLVFRSETFGKLPHKDELLRRSKTSIYNGKKFINTQPTPMKINVVAIWKDFIKNSKIKKKPDFEVPVIKHTIDSFSSQPSDKLRVIWLGHSSVLIELDGLRIMVDPVLGLRASPILWAGVKRLHDTPIPVNGIPHIDFILLSHNHYDHMDMATIRQFIGKKTKFMVPLGLKQTLLHWGISSGNIVEMDWNESIIIQSMTIIAFPARHFSGRRLKDRDKTLWCSWGVKGKNGSLFHSGDSGFFEGYKDIGEEYGPFSLSMIGIGAYNKLWAPIHTFPEEAVNAHQLIKAEKLLPVHWATFNLALHAYLEPVNKLLKYANSKEVNLILPQIGEWVDVENYIQNAYWWV